MDLRDSLDQISAALQRILSILAEGRQSLSVPEATQWKALALTRWQMLQALRVFNEAKTRLVLDPLIDSGLGPVSARAASIKDRNADLQTVYDAFVKRWALTSPLSVTDRYSKEALGMARRIEAQVLADVQEMEALAKEAETHPDMRRG